MLSTRVIPCLLLEGSRLVKTVKFGAPKYVGDIINAVRIFNDKEVDEIVVLDTRAHERGSIQWTLIEQVASECFMPMCYGGGVTTVEQMKRLYGLGVEKVALNTAAIERPSLISEAARTFGSQSIVVSIDARRSLLGGYHVCTRGGSKKVKRTPVDVARAAEAEGAGEIMLTSIDRDGTQSGYDLELIRSVTSAVRVPVIACGGAGGLADFKQAVGQGGASAVAAGSMFVFHGKHRAVLITYPTRAQLEASLGR